jgi:AraC family transcriptional regulator
LGIKTPRFGKSPRKRGLARAASVKKRPSQRFQTIAIKNMVCDRCIRVVREELESLGFEVRSVALGQATIVRRRGRATMEHIRQMLRRNGFDLLDDRRSRIVQKIKTAVLILVRTQHDDQDERVKDSKAIERAVGLNYRSLSTLFSSTEGITIERYTILQKIERVKELLRYDELSLKEIAYQLGYSSLAHLSSQFKKVTGMSARTYKKLNDAQRIPLDSV